MAWVERRLKEDPQLRVEVEALIDEIGLEQDLIQLRKARGLSQVRLAEMVGVTQPAIAKIESGKASNMQLKTLLRIVTALGGRVRIEIQRLDRVPKTLERRAAAGEV
ncbi:MAG: XRE family transcriptional regulator [Candidatus Rokubacteria bacterium]|nr:XRE family transcriptional regulator [Candidatus Rokubacteria bacterium]